MKKFLCSLLAFAFLGFGLSTIFLNSSYVFAQTDTIDFTEDPCEGGRCFGPPEEGEIPDELNADRSLREQVISIVNYFLTFVGLIAVVAIIYGGFLWILSGGDEENFTKGKKIVLYAAAGIILILLSYTIVNFLIGAGDFGNDDGDSTTYSDEDLLPPGSVLNDDGTVTLPDGNVVDLDDVSNNRISTIITGGPNRGEAPLRVQLSGTRSRYMGVDETIPDSAFHWSYKDRNGQTVELGTGPTLQHTLTEEGRFVFTLRIDKRESGPELVDGIATFSVEVTSTLPETAFRINGRDAKPFQQFSLAEAGQGITFVPAVSSSAEDREYAWDFGDGSPVLRTETAETVSHVFSRNGDFTVTLTVTDSFGAVNRRSVRISIADVVARFEITPAEKFVGEPISFSAQRSNSSFGDILEAVWTLIDSTGETEEVRSQMFTRTFETSGNLQVSLSVRDTAGNTAVYSETILIRSHPPTANFRAEQKSRSEPATYVFEGGISSDPDGDSLLYSWDFGNDGSFEIKESASSRAEFSFTTLGTHNVKLQVKDPSGETDETVKKMEIDSLLNVDFSADRFVAHPGEEITFVAEAPNAITYFWDFGDDFTTQGTQGSVQHAFREKGEYRVRLTAFDSNDEEVTAERTVYIGEKDMPVAVFEVRQRGVLRLIQTNYCGEGKNGIAASRSEYLTFDAAPSVNRDGESSGLEYEWIFHDGTFSRERTVQKRFEERPQDQCFPVKLTVRDANSGKQDMSETIWIKIENALPEMDALRISIPENKTAPVVVPLSVQNPRDRDGSIIEYKWWAYREGDSTKIGLHTTPIPSSSVTLPVYGLGEETNRYFFVVELRDNLGAVINSEDIFGKSSFVEATNGENRSPQVDFQVEKTSVDEGDTITFFATATDPLGGSIPDSAYMWDFNGDNIFDAVGAGPQVTHRFDRPGEFAVRLKVVHRGLASSAEHSVFVARKHRLPKAAFTFMVQGHNVKFDATTAEVDSTVPRNAASFAWDLDQSVDSDGDGDATNDIDSTQKQFQHFYEELGTRAVKLTITDILGVQDEVIRNIPVAESGKLVGGGSGTNTNGTTIRSVRLQASHPMTTLDVLLNRQTVAVGEEVMVYAFVKNADNTLFNGSVEFTVVSGTATFQSAAGSAVSGEVSNTITANGTGIVLIEVTAKDTVSGDITETIAFRVE